MQNQDTNYTFPLVEGIELNDCHIHIHHWEDGVKNSKQNFMEQLEDYRRTFGISRTNVVCVPYCYDRDVCQNIMGAILKLEHPDCYVHAGLVYPSCPVTLPFPEGFTPEQQLADAMAVGFDGIKMLEQKPNVRKMLGLSAADACYEAYFSKLEEEQIHVLWHAKDPETFWDPKRYDAAHPDWSYSGEGYLSYEQIHEEVCGVLRKHPKLKITFAHLFFLEHHPDRLIELLETYPNLGVDITPHTEMFMQMSKDRDTWRAFFTKYADRILFGTDYTTERGKILAIGHENVYQFLLTDEPFLFWNGGKAHGLGLDRTAVEKILGGSFYGKMGKEPKPINREALKTYIHKYECMIKNTAQREQIMAYCQQHHLL